MTSENNPPASGVLKQNKRLWPRTHSYAGMALLLGLLLVLGTKLLSEIRHRGRYQPTRRIDLNKTGPDAASDKTPAIPLDQRLRVAVAPVISPEKSLPQYDAFARFIASRVDREPTILRRQTYAQINDLVRYQRCDLAFTCTYPYVRGKREFGMQALAVPVVNGKTTYQSFILVPARSQAKSILDLKSKTFASADIMSNSGWLFPAGWLKTRDIDPNHFFARHVISGSHDRSVDAVASGFVDGAAVDSLVYEEMVDSDPDLEERVTVILRSPPFGIPPLVVHPKLAAPLRQQLLTALLDMHNDPKGHRILNSLRIQRFEVPAEGLFKSVEETARIVEALQ